VAALPQDLISATLMTKRELEQRRVDLLGVLVNRVDRGNMHGLSRECSKVFADNGIPVCCCQQRSKRMQDCKRPVQVTSFDSST
jgi:hypothetical protein